MARAIQFRRIPGSGALQAGNAVAQGLNNAMANYAKMRMQKQQMESNKIRAQGYGDWMRSRAEAQRTKDQQTNLAKLNLLNAIKTKGSAVGLDPSLIKSAEKPLVESLMANMKPDEANAFAARINAQADAGKISPEFESQLMSVSPNEQQAMKWMQGNETRENVAGIRADAVMYGADRSVDRAKISAGKNGGSVGSKADLQAMRDLQKQMSQVSNQMSSLDKPTPMGALPLDDKVKEQLKQKYSSDLVDLHGQYQQLHEKLSGKPQEKPAQREPQSVAPPNVLPHDQWSSAKPGDIIQHSNGQHYQAVDGGVIPVAPPAPQPQPSGE